MSSFTTQLFTKLLFCVQIEEFWQLHNNLIGPNQMEINSDLHFFKSGIRPLWEDPANKNGGKWVYTIKNNTEHLTKSWLEVVSII